jgi:hypothetical protein
MAHQEAAGSSQEAKQKCCYHILWMFAIFLNFSSPFCRDGDDGSTWSKHNGRCSEKKFKEPVRELTLNHQPIFWIFSKTHSYFITKSKNPPNTGQKITYCIRMGREPNRAPIFFYFHLGRRWGNVCDLMIFSQNNITFQDKHAYLLSQAFEEVQATYFHLNTHDTHEQVISGFFRFCKTCFFNG